MEQRFESFSDSDVGLLVRMLARLVDASAEQAVVRTGKDSAPADLTFQLGDRTFVVEVKSSGRAAPVSMAVQQLQTYMEALPERTVPILVVPYMGEVGRKLCREGGVAWLDLSGNADISADRLRVHVEGRPNRFLKRGRPANVFAPKSSRVARALLMHPARGFQQRELACMTGLGEGYTSRIVRKLEAEGLVRRANGSVYVSDPALLLDAWREGYDFTRHRILKGHVAARSSDALMRNLAGFLVENEREHAVTGMGAAWLLTHFAGFRIVTCYVRTLPEEDFLNEFGFKETNAGANTWIVVPNDPDVFRGARTIEGVRCVSPLQTYLDLKGHPERSAEAATRLREEYLRFDQDA